MREFLHVDDLGQAVLYALENKLDEHLCNVGSGSDLTIKALAEMIQKVVGHNGDIIWDDTKPDGTPHKLMDVSKLEKYLEEIKWWDWSESKIKKNKKFFYLNQNASNLEELQSMMIQ